MKLSACKLYAAEDEDAARIKRRKRRTGRRIEGRSSFSSVQRVYMVLYNIFDCAAYYCCIVAVVIKWCCDVARGDADGRDYYWTLRSPSPPPRTDSRQPRGGDGRNVTMPFRRRFRTLTSNSRESVVSISAAQFW